ncbi:MAG: hypothetical protein SFZ23_01145 [Planctomycetota bacterium]|nr:hypothetical protein [Planctomycetota bacterium]
MTFLGVPIGVALVGVVTSYAGAQIGTATFTWQASVDHGQTWQSNFLQIDQSMRNLKVRGWLDWSPDAGVSVAATTFDCMIRTSSTGDAVDDPTRREPFNSFPQQTLVATRFDDTIKIDDVRDTSPPGVGTRGVVIGQTWADSGFPNTLDRPLSLLDFSLRLSSDPGDRTIDSEFLWVSQFDVAIYISRSGSRTNLPLTTTVPLTIRVIPAPGPMAALAALAVIATRRRRVEHNRRPSRAVGSASPAHEKTAD